MAMLKEKAWKVMRASLYFRAFSLVWLIGAWIVGVMSVVTPDVISPQAPEQFTRATGAGFILTAIFVNRQRLRAQTIWSDHAIQSFGAFRDTPILCWNDLSHIDDHLFGACATFTFGKTGKVKLNWRWGYVGYQDFNDLLRFGKRKLKENARTS